MESEFPTCQVSIPNAYMSLAFVIWTVGFPPGLCGRISSGALPRKKPTASFSGHRSGREIMREEPKPAMRGVPSGSTKTFCYENVSLGMFWQHETSGDLTGERWPCTISRSCTCFNPRAIPRTWRREWGSGRS
jgi:hypothetical protein